MNFATDKSTATDPQHAILQRNLETDLGIPIWDMLAAIPIRSRTPCAPLPKCSNNVSQRTQTLINGLRLLHPLLLRPIRKAHIQPLTPGQIHQIQRTFASLPRPSSASFSQTDINPANPERKHRMRARASFIDHRRCDASPLLRLCEECAYLRGGVEGHDIDIGHPCRTRLGIVLDLVFLFVEVMFSEEIVDRFIVLRKNEQVSALDEDGEERGGDARFQGTGLPFGIPSLWTSSLGRRGKLAQLRAGSSLRYLRSE
jgi:hypothetical protein